MFVLICRINKNLILNNQEQEKKRKLAEKTMLKKSEFLTSLLAHYDFPALLARVGIN